MYLGDFCYILILDADHKTVNEVTRMRVLLADAQPKVRFALKVLLERQTDLLVAGEAVDTEDLLAQTRSICPDLVLLAWDLPGLEATVLLPSLRDLCPGVIIIALSGRPEARRVALAAGVDAFVSKSDPPEHLMRAIERQEQLAGD